MCPPPCSCATDTKRMPASSNKSSASMYAEPTIPNTSRTPCATSVSTKASDGVIFCLPVTAIRLASVIVFMATPDVRAMSAYCRAPMTTELGPARSLRWVHVAVTQTATSAGRARMSRGDRHGWRGERDSVFASEAAPGTRRSPFAALAREAGVRRWRNRREPRLHHRLGRNVLVAQRLGDRLAGHLAEGDVQAILQVRIADQRALPAFVREREHERQRRV